MEKRRAAFFQRKIALLEALAFTDALTGIPNRTAFHEKVERYVKGQENRSPDHKTIVAYVDIDHFKMVNDIFGHDVGDVVLKEVANRISSVFQRELDSVYRYGGEEFIIMANIRPEDASNLCALVSEAISCAPIMDRGVAHEVTVSIGYAFIDEGDDHIRQRVVDCIENADIALYNAKKAGRNCYIAYDPTFSEVA